MARVYPTPWPSLPDREFMGMIDYLNPAPPAERPTFSGTLLLNTGNKVSDVQSIYPGGSSPATGINLAQGAVGVVIENRQVGNALNPVQRFNIGIGSAGVAPFSNQALIEQVTIFAGNTGINFGGPSLIVRNSVINGGWACTGVIRSTFYRTKRND